MSKSEIVRLDRELASIRRRLKEKGLAEELTKIDKIIAKDLERKYFRESKKDIMEELLEGVI